MLDSIKQFVKQIDKEMMSEYNTPENFIVFVKNKVKTKPYSIWICEPLTQKGNTLIFGYASKGFVGDRTKYHCFIIRNSVLDNIKVPECAKKKTLQSNKEHTYVAFKEFDESAKEFLRNIARYYIENFEPKDKFGCCSKFEECSAAGECLHDNKFYSKACWYRKNLEAGNIFY